MQELFERSEGLLKRLEKASKFGSKFQIYPYQEAGRIVEDLSKLAESIPDIQDPTSKDEVMQSELKRRLQGEAANLEHYLSGRTYDFDTVVALYGIPTSDIAGLRPWLEANRAQTMDSIDRLFQSTPVENYEMGLQVDIPNVRRQSEEFSAVQIQKYHKRLGKLLQDLSKIGEYLREINAVPTTEGRSYFHPLTTTLAIGIPAICFSTEDGSLHLRERELIKLYGHEGMGHALNHVVTNTNGLPYFLTRPSSLAESTMESVAQFYERVIFDDLRDSPETQRALDIEHSFDRIYTEAKDRARLEEYQLKLFQYAITVLGDKSLGDPNDPAVMKQKVDLLSEVTLDPSFPLGFVEQHRHSFDSQGNLNAQLVGELRYAARPVDRALEEFGKKGINYNGPERSTIDETLLKGFWTPIGFVDNAKVTVQQKYK